MLLLLFCAALIVAHGKQVLSLGDADFVDRTKVKPSSSPSFICH